MRLGSTVVTQSQESVHRSGLTGFLPLISGRRALAAIMAVAVVLRLLSALYQGNTVVALPGIYDQISYDGLAQRVVAGYGFSFAEGHWPATRGGEPTAHWSYLYTLYLAAVYSIFGVQPLIARLIQAVVTGILHCWLAWRIGKRVFGPRVGLVAAGLSAIYVYFSYYAGGLVTEPFYMIGILWTLDVSQRIVAGRREALEGERSVDSKFQVPWRTWIELGLAIGITVLLRQLFLLFVPFVFLWVWWNWFGKTDQDSTDTDDTISRVVMFVRPRALLGMVGATLVIVALIAPWTFRNYRAFGTFVPLNTNAGYAFFWGNHPIHGTSFMPLLSVDGVSYGDLIPEELRHLNEAELDRALLELGIREVLSDPQRFFLLSLSRAREYFKFWPSAKSSTVSNISRVASFGVLLPFMLYGLIISLKLIYRPHYYGQAADLLLLLLFMIFYAMVHLLTWTLIRYRLPIDAVLIVFAAYGLSVLAAQLRILDIGDRSQRHAALSADSVNAE